MRIFSFLQHQNTLCSWRDPPAVSITSVHLKEILSGLNSLQAKPQGSDPAPLHFPGKCCWYFFELVSSSIHVELIMQPTLLLITVKPNPPHAAHPKHYPTELQLCSSCTSFYAVSLVLPWMDFHSLPRSIPVPPVANNK